MHRVKQEDVAEIPDVDEEIKKARLYILANVAAFGAIVAAIRIGEHQSN